MSHNHYFKDVSRLDSVDVYRVLELFEVVEPAIQHAVKKLLCAGGRGAKSQPQDVQEAMNYQGFPEMTKTAENVKRLYEELFVQHLS